jgi:hypothetical protein
MVDFDPGDDRGGQGARHFSWLENWQSGCFNGEATWPKPMRRPDCCQRAGIEYAYYPALRKNESEMRLHRNGAYSFPGTAKFTCYFLWHTFQCHFAGHKYVNRNVYATWRRVFLRYDAQKYRSFREAGLPHSIRSAPTQPAPCEYIYCEEFRTGLLYNNRPVRWLLQRCPGTFQLQSWKPRGNQRKLLWKKKRSALRRTHSFSLIRWHHLHGDVKSCLRFCALRRLLTNQICASSVKSIEVRSETWNSWSQNSERYGSCHYLLE